MEQLTKERLEQLGFIYHEGNAFENNQMQYYAREAILLFFNDSPPENTYLIGYGFSTFEGKYYAASFKWITKEQELREVYKAINNTEV